MAQADDYSPTAIRGAQVMQKQGRPQAMCHVVAGLVLLISLSGCGVDWGYISAAAAGQIDILRKSVPISQAAENAALTSEQRSKLNLIRDARVYADEIIGLNTENNYTLFYDSDGEPVAFNVSACRKDAFEPRSWTFPIVGTVPYLGFFDRQAADAKYNELVAEQLDVFMYEIDAYSGLWYFPTVVLSPVLERSEIDLVESVFHELLHSTIWRTNDVTFNESLATFVGRTAAIEYLALRYPEQPELVQYAIEQFEDVDRFSDFILTVFNELDDFYSSDLPSETKIADREATYQAGRDRFAADVQPLMNHPDMYAWVRDLPTNNAWLLGVQRYNLDLDVFQDVFTATSEDWPACLELFHAAAAERNPYTYLQTWLAAPRPTSPAHLKGGERTRDRQTAVPAQQRSPRGVCPGRSATTLVGVESRQMRK